MRHRIAKKTLNRTSEHRSALIKNLSESLIIHGKIETTIDKAKDTSFPNDAYLIWYKLEEETHIDLVRGSRVRIFDMYYDKYGPGAVQKIDFGYGRTNPKLWGIKQPEKKKRR